MVAPFDSPFPTDRVLEGLAREIIRHSSADHYLSDRHKAFGSALNERLRLARELHDGLLQSLTGATLQLETALRLIDSDPRAARDQVREAQELILERQRELRAWIDSVRHPRYANTASLVDLAPVLGKLCSRVSRWGPRVKLDSRDLARIPACVADHVYRIVEESLSNVTRHAHARLARVDVRVSPGLVRIVVSDDGCGFAFRGRYDLATLDARRIGPKSLKERVTSLAGTLVLTSTLSGSTVDIELPSSPRHEATDIHSPPTARQQVQP